MKKEQILNVVAAAFEVPADRIKTKGRRPEVVSARRAFWYMLYRMGCSQTVCAEATAYDRSSVSNGITELLRSLSTDVQLKKKLMEVEEQLGLN